MTFSERCSVAIKVIVFAVCLSVVFSGKHPPMFAQKASYPVVPILTVEDAVQDHDITELNKHIEATDARVHENTVATQTNSSMIAGMQGEERIIGGILATLMGISITLNVRKKTV